MSTDAAKPPPQQADVSIESVLSVQQHNLWQRVAAAQSFWVTIALILICVVMSWLQPTSFASSENFFNITRNFSFIGIMALGMTAVIATGGIDLSVGAILAASGVLGTMAMESGMPVPVGMAVPLAGATVAVNGTVWPAVEGLVPAESVVVVVVRNLLLTVWVRGVAPLELKLLSPL